MHCVWWWCNISDLPPWTYASAMCVMCVQAHAAGSLNAEYLAREGATIRATKTSSASLVRASGKDGKSAGCDCTVDMATLIAQQFSCGQIADLQAQIIVTSRTAVPGGTLPMS